jgi:hypothetical protein
MLRRLLNIASIACLILCVALMGMWVRSYALSDRASGQFDAGHGFQMTSLYGRLGLYIGTSGLDSYFYFTTDVIAPVPIYTGPPPPQLALSDFGFDAFVLASGRFLFLPYWFLTLVAGSLAMAFQLRWPWRFTLRSLFIATTFLAVVLGMIAWLDRAWIGK